MAEYYEVKMMLVRLLRLGKNETIGEDDDIILSFNKRSISRKESTKIEERTLKDEDIKKSYNSMKKKQTVDMQLYSKRIYEIAVKSRWSRNEDKTIEDPINKIEYSYCSASLEYILMICDKLCEDKEAERRFRQVIRFNTFIMRDDISIMEHIARSFRIKTIRIQTKKPIELSQFNKMCDAFEYSYMFRTNYSILKVSCLSDIYEQNGGGKAREYELDEPPRRTVNHETLGYYAMAIDSEDPFTKYISYYHVIEYYFDAVYKKKLISELKGKLTDPSFSYKDDDKLYDLAKWVGKRVKSDVEVGLGNEFDSLKYVLEEYVQIEELLNSLNEFNTSLKDYYCLNNVIFSGSKKDKISWDNREGVYTNLTNRIYNTRNALVHSKSGQLKKQYKPQEHIEALNKELYLIRAIAELIICADGDVL